MKKFLAVLLLLALPITVSADETFRVFNFRDFSKGLNSHISQFQTADTQCSVAQNVRFNKSYSAVSKRNVMRAYGSAGSHSIQSLHRYYSSNDDKLVIATGSTNMYVGNDDTGAFQTIKSGLTDGKKWQFVTYKDVAIGMNGYDNAIKYDGTTDVTANTDGHRTAENVCADLGAPFAELNTGSNLDASSWYQYKVAFYDGSNYSYCTARSNAIQTGSSVQDITLTDIPLGPTGTTARYVYRTLGNSSKTNVEADTTFYKIATISDNTTRTLNDAMDDTTASADAAPTWSTVSAGTDVTPPKGAYCIVNNERLFISGNTTYRSDIYWSDQFNPDYFDPTDYEVIREDDGDEITFMKVQLGILTIGKSNTIQKFYTQDASSDNWSISDPFSFVGCAAPYTATNTPLGIIYLSRKGLYRFTGQNSEFISDAVTPDMEDILQTNYNKAVGYYFKQEYHLSYTSEDSGAVTNNRVLVYDIVRDAYAKDIKAIDSFCAFDSGTDVGILYMGSASTDGYVWADEAEVPVVEKKYKSDLDAGTFDDTRSLGTETDPQIELAWDCTIDTWLTELQTKDANINTIDDIIIYLPDAIIDRPDTDGTWTSPVYEVNAGALEQIVWNESLGLYGDITCQVRTGDVITPDGTWTAWSTAGSDPNGTSLTSVTAGTYLQIRFNLSTTNINYTPILYENDGYIFRLFYSKVGSTMESDVTSIWQSGWTAFGVPGYKKTIKRIKVFYRATEGTLTCEYENDEGNVSRSFDIDMSTTVPYDADGDTYYDYYGVGDYKIFKYHPRQNTETDEYPFGDFFRFKLTETGTGEWHVDRIEVLYYLEEIYD